MLVRFSVQNFRSIGENPITLNMISSTKEKRHADHVVNLGSAKILRDAVIYGANAAGKSNVIQALNFLVDSLRFGSLVRRSESWYCKTTEGGAEKETTFDIQFEVDGIFYDYGFDCILAKREVSSEWLYKVEPKSEKALLEREGSSVKAHFLKKLGKESRKRIEVYADDFEGYAEQSPDTLFFASLNKGKTFDSDSGLEFLQKIYTWLTSNILIFTPDSRKSSSFMFYYTDLDRAGNLLSTFDTGITSLVKESIAFDDLAGRLPDEVKKALQKTLDEHPSMNAMTLRGGGVLAGIERKAGQDPEVTILKLKHEGTSLSFEFAEESDGTRRLFDILDMLLTNDKDTVFVVDELSRSLHPLLTKHFVDLFNEVHADDNCQLVFTTHENDVMSFDHFRRDEIWFVERESDGISKLYPLDKFVVRSDARIERGYIAGRYGGIPVLSMQKSMAALADGTDESSTEAVASGEQH